MFLLVQWAGDVASKLLGADRPLVYGGKRFLLDAQRQIRLVECRSLGPYQLRDAPVTGRDEA